MSIALDSCLAQNGDNRILLVNAETLDRKGIASLISVINLNGPKVIAIDLKFIAESDYESNWLLFNELSSCKNLVLPSVIGGYIAGKHIDYTQFVDEPEPQFLVYAKTGFVNAMQDVSDLRKVKQFSTNEMVKGEIEYHFSVRTAMCFDSLKALSFVAKNPRIVDIDYKDGERKFKVFSASDILSGKFAKKDIFEKIVLIGFLGPGDDDKFFTPLNTNPTQPDMYGVENLANIISQILE
jgi:CHASE2 domain-containing sensor protein